MHKDRHLKKKSSVWKNLAGLHRALTSAPSNTFGDELEHNVKQTSVANFTDSRAAEWEQIPRAWFQHFMESIHRTVEAVIASR